MSRQFDRVLLSELPAKPPTEFRLFKPGINATAKGPVNFDTQAARTVMANYAQRGTDIMLDLEHDSLSESARATRNDAADSMGWFKLTLKPDGSLWATDVRWTPEGARRLAARSQRYTSPAFTIDADDRPTRVINVALCAMPATHSAEALVAASHSGILSARLPKRQIDKLRTLATARRTTTSALVRTLIDALPSGATDDTAETIAAVCDALGLPEDADAESIKSAVLALLFPSDAGAADAAPELADPAVPAQALLTRLSASDAPVTKNQAARLIEASAQGKLRPSNPREHLVLDSARRVARGRK